MTVLCLVSCVMITDDSVRVVTQTTTGQVPVAQEAGVILHPDQYRNDYCGTYGSGAF